MLQYPLTSSNHGQLHQTSYVSSACPLKACICDCASLHSRGNNLFKIKAWNITKSKENQLLSSQINIRPRREKTEPLLSSSAII